MFEKRNLTYVLTILEAIEKIWIYTNDIESADEFYKANDQLNFNATQALLLVIGEESKKINVGLKDEFSDIPWHLIAGLRNRIAHDYRSIDPNISFDVVKNYLPELKNTLIQMISKIEHQHDFLIKIVQTDYYKHLQYLIDE